MTDFIMVTLDLLPHSIRTVGRPRVKGRGLFLWDLLYFAVQFTGGRLVETHAVGQAAGLDGVQQTQRPDAVDVCRVLCQIERNLKRYKTSVNLEELSKDTIVSRSRQTHPDDLEPHLK